MPKNNIPAYVSKKPISVIEFKKYADFLGHQGFKFCGSGTGATVKYVTFDTPNRTKYFSWTMTKDDLQITISNNNVAACHNKGISTGKGKIHYKECGLNEIIEKFDTLFTPSK